MYTSQKNETLDEGAGKSASKSKKKKLQLIHHSKDKFHVSAAYALTSSKNLASKNINWQESEWPELPKSSSSQPTTALKEESQCESSSKEDSDVKSKEPGLSSKPHAEECLPEEQIQKCKTKSLQTPTNQFICPIKELEHITSSLTALNMSSKCHQHALTGTRGNIISQQGCLKKVPSAILRKGKKLQIGKINPETCSTGNALLRENCDSPPICDEDFPDLLAVKKITKVRKKHFAPVEDVAAKRSTKKYPRRTDPISINLGEVLELTSSKQDNNNVLKRRYSRDLWPGKTRIDTSRRVIKRGKQREFPRKKTLTKLKLAILRGRQHKINSRQHNNANLFNEGACSLEYCGTLEFVHADQADKADTSLEGCKLFPGDETLVDLRYLFEHCSSDVNVPIGSIQYDPYSLDVSGRSPQSGPSPLPEEGFSDNEILQQAKSCIHTRKFREYCNNDNCAVLQEKVKLFVKQIYRFQTKAHFRDAERARIHKRYVLGLREADKYLKLRKLKVVVITTDLEANSEDGGLDEMIENMKSRARLENIPIIFALKRRDLAYCVFRKVPVSCMAVLNYEGAEDLYRAMIDAWREAIGTYHKKLKEKKREILGAKLVSADDCTPTENIESSYEPTDLLENPSTIHESESET